MWELLGINRAYLTIEPGNEIPPFACILQRISIRLFLFQKPFRAGLICLLVENTGSRFPKPPAPPGSAADARRTDRRVANRLARLPTHSTSTASTNVNHSKRLHYYGHF